MGHLQQQSEPPQTADLSPAEREFYFAWKRTHQQVAAAIAEAVTEETGLSSAETAVLVHLDAGPQHLRQAELRAQLGWDRSRLSHQLTRMTERGLVERTKASRGTLVSLTEQGTAAIEQIRPVHAEAVRRVLLRPLNDLTAARRMLDSLDPAAARRFPTPGPTASPQTKAL